MLPEYTLPLLQAVSNVHNVTAVHESPHDRMHWYIELAWIFSTGIGILLFIIQMALIGWVRFYKHRTAAIVSTAITIPALIIFIAFAVHFYRQLIAHKYERSTKGLEELESMANQLEQGNGMQIV
jgi:calcium release-activated calcium channel protein 1